MQRFALHLMDFLLSEWTAIAAFVGVTAWVFFTAPGSGFNWLHGLSLFLTTVWMVMLVMAGTATAAGEALIDRSR